MNIINRRSFFRNTAIGSAGLIMLPSFYNASLFGASPKDLKKGVGGLVPISIIEDVNFMLQRTGAFTGSNYTAITSHLYTKPAPPGNKGRLAVVLPVNDNRIFTLLEFIKNSQQEKNTAARKSIAFNWICNNITFNYLKGIYGDTPSPDKIKDVQLYHDAALIKALSYSSLTQEVNAEELTNFFLEILPRAFTRVHTLKPADDGAEWVNRISEWKRDNNSYMARLAETILKPDAIKLKQYVTEPDLYNVNDGIIQKCRALNHAKYVSQTEIRQEIENSVPKSIYAQIVKEACNQLLMANQFFNNKIGLDELKTKITV